MDSFIIKGGQKLIGKVNIPPAKNACLPILAACILCEQEVVLCDCPKYTDIDNMCAVLNSLGVETTRNNRELIINAKNVTNASIPHNITGSIRSSIFSLGAILSRLKKAKIAQPGGCAIGARPIDLHIKGLQTLGVKIKEKNGFLICDGKNMKANDVELPFPSVGATENIILASVFLKGKTTIKGAAKEPEIEDLQNFLNSCGAKVSGAGTDLISIEGVEKLGGAIWTPLPDRIITGTMVIACLMTGGKIEICNCRPKHIEKLLEIIDKSSCKIEVNNDIIKVESIKRAKSIKNIETYPYPLFPTDLQPQIMALQTISKGKSIIKENLFETRYKHVKYLCDMGAKIKISGKTAIIYGKKQLSGRIVEAEDLRGGVALVLAGLCAKGITKVNNVQFIDRGYEQFEEVLKNLGADIKREK